MSAREAMTLVSQKLRVAKLRGTLGVDPCASGAERSGYAVARRLARMPALARLEELDVSHNELDGLAARALARSRYLSGLRVLDWSGNDEGDEVEALWAALAPEAVRKT